MHICQIREILLLQKQHSSHHSTIKVHKYFKFIKYSTGNFDKTTKSVQESVTADGWCNHRQMVSISAFMCINEHLLLNTASCQRRHQKSVE